MRAVVGHRAGLHQLPGHLDEAEAARQAIGGDAVFVACRRIGAGVEQETDGRGRAATADGVQQGAAAGAGFVRVAAVGEQQAHRVGMLMIERAEQRVAAGDAGAGFEQQADDAAVGDLGGVVERFVVVGVGAGLQQSPRECDVVVATGGAVQDAEWLVRQLRIDPSRIRIGAGIEQQVHAGADARRIPGQGDQSGKGGAGQRRHAVPGAGRIGPGGIGREGGLHRGDVADGAGQLGLAGEQVRMLA